MTSEACIKQMIKDIDKEMSNIEQISLEDELYNDLYLELRVMRGTLVKVARHQHRTSAIRGEIETIKEIEKVQA